MKVAIVGASGYAGQELMRLVNRHKYFTLEDAVSNSWSGKNISLLIGKHKNTLGRQFISVDTFMEKYLSYDLIFLALPHGESAKFYMKIKNFKGIIIDLSSDFRLSKKNRHIWKNDEHICEDKLDSFIYGLSDVTLKSELQEKSNGKLVANPGCYATSILLATVPCVSKLKSTIDNISVCSMSGVSGAGYKATMKNSYCEINENTYAYGLKNHNHIAEMEDYLLSHYDFNKRIQFTPHLIPINRGISSTCYISLSDKHIVLSDFAKDLKKMYKDFYSDSEFVYILDEIPNVKDVNFTNQCHIYVDYDDKTNNIIVISVIDNLMKGASGQAIQNANKLCGFSQSEGLLGGYYENS